MFAVRAWKRPFAVPPDQVGQHFHRLQGGARPFQRQPHQVRTPGGVGFVLAELLDPGLLQDAVGLVVMQVYLNRMRRSWLDLEEGDD